ncbi:hypothetical protein Pmani_022588 [Petrolisthes manimaculis]|uniref:Minichromosome loss protein Mcl1 middle region domain-containing protein n=1 Tax=Petrolisthes manimaculis TaxID=1843537 RepID=A0AAE1PE79_9EUCA|nr:hypothetical protein Pmani_022588 [Petrolisthes manimaculis]
MAPQKMRPMRYAHFEGHTDICYTDDGRYIVTCGSDGEVRVFEGLDDDDFKTHLVAECASAVVCTGTRILVGTDNNLVQAITLEEGASDGIIIRFTAPPTHLAVSKDGYCVVGGASDMTIRVHGPADYNDRVLTGHKAPILSVALDPKGEYLASSSCDGTVKIWQLGTTSIISASWNLLPATNSFSASSTLCRMAWLPSGETVCVPVGSAVNLYSRNDWQLMYQLTDEAVTETLSIVTASPCGKFLAASSTKGDIVVWDVATKGTVIVEKHPKALNISGLKWNPSGKSEIAFVDINGQFGTIENVVEVDYRPKVQGKENGISAAPFPPLTSEDYQDGGATNQTEDEDDDEYSIAKIKSQLGFADDEAGTFLGVAGGLHNEDSRSSATQPTTTTTAAPPPQTLRLPEPQRPFQPGMSPEHLIDRYMVWNNVGIVRQYNTPDSKVNEDDGSIEVEFHDTSVHHALHFGNPSLFTMAALSSQALILASEAREEVPSKLSVHHFAAWGGGGSNKEWHLDLTSGEEAVSVAAGVGFVALATDRHTLRLFSSAGVQREVLCAAGKVVCIAAHQDLLMVVCHSGMGVSGEQSMSIQVLRIGGKGGKGRHPLPFPTPLPLSPRSYLAWAGFTDEGTPLTMDSTGIVRMMHYKYGYTWTIVLDSKMHTRGKSDHYFLIGASERQSNVRCILCKGSRFPPVLPKPHVSILNMKIPLCEGETEKGELEEACMRSSLLLQTLTDSSAEEEEEAKHKIERSVKEAMIKLFALACRGDLDARALDVCQLMPSHQTVGLAIKYAAKLRKLHLADKLGEVAAAKMKEEERERERELEEEDVYRYNSWDTQARGNGTGFENENEESLQQDEDMEEQLEEEDEERERQRRQDNPLLMAAARKRSENTFTTSLLLSPATKNPFRRSNTLTTNTKKGIDVIDRFRKSQKKSESSPVLRPVVRKPQNKQQQLLGNKCKASQEEGTSTTQTPPESSTQATGKENQLSGQSITTATQNNTQMTVEEPEPPTTTTTATAKKPSALLLWLRDHREEVLKRYPGGDSGEESDLVPTAAMMFKDVDASVKQKYKNLAAGITPINTEESDKKRKLEDEDKDSPDHKKKSQNIVKASGLSKLSSFKFSKASQD